MSLVVSLSGAELKMSDSTSEVSVNFVLAVLRQHEVEFDRLIAQLEMLVNKVNELATKIEHTLI
jgi:hypothetical protein